MFDKSSDKKHPGKPLPHLPKGTTMPQARGYTMAYESYGSLPSSQQSTTQSGPLVSQRSAVAAHNGNVNNTPWYSQGNAQTDREPPPVFSSQPRGGMTTLGRRGSVLQQRVCRMEAGIDPVDLLCDRLGTWRLSIKSLVKLFKSIHQVESKCAKGYCNSSKDITTPLEHGPGHFLETGGLQEIWLALKDYAIDNGTTHQDYVNFIDRAILPGLRGIKADIKAMITSIRRDSDLKNGDLYQSRLTVDKLVARLDKSIKSMSYTTLDSSHATADPVLCSQAVNHAIVNLHEQENILHNSILDLQKEMSLFDQKIVQSLQLVFCQFQEFQLENNIESPDLITEIVDKLNAIQPQTEWNEFVHRHQLHLVKENAAFKSEWEIQYPNKDHLLSRVIKAGALERKSSILKQWGEEFYVLSPAGYLHGYKSFSHFLENALSPECSIFLPQTSFDMDEIDELDEDCNEFELRGKDGQGKISLEKTFCFRAMNNQDFVEWIQCIHKIMERFKPVPLLPEAVDSMNQPRITNREAAPAPAPAPAAITPSALDVSPSNQAWRDEEQRPVDHVHSSEHSPISEKHLAIEHHPTVESTSTTASPETSVSSRDEKTLLHNTKHYAKMHSMFLPLASNEDAEQKQRKPMDSTWDGHQNTDHLREEPMEPIGEERALNDSSSDEYENPLDNNNDHWDAISEDNNKYSQFNKPHGDSPRIVQMDTSVESKGVLKSLMGLGL